MAASNYKIGEVATRMGISVRTLRHYDEVGLLRPSSRTAAGHRLYTDKDLARLKKIVAFRKMGFSLHHIRTVLSENIEKAFKTLEGQATRLREQISQQEKVLKSVEGVLDFKEMFTRFRNPELDHLKKEGAALFTALMAEMECGTDPKAPRVQEMIQQMEAGTGMVDYFGGREKMAERLAFVKNNMHLIPQGDPAEVDKMKERMKPFGEKIKRLAEYLRRAKA